MSQLLWGIDLGGTKIEGVVIAADNPSLPRTRIRIDTEQQHGYRHIVSRIALLIDQLAAEVGERPTRIGISHPGAVDRESGKVKNSNTVCLIGEALPSEVSEAVNAKIIVENDANCFALAEAKFGAARGASSVFGIIMGTGVGGGIIIDGKVQGGLQGIAGEWGHNELITNGPECYCGKLGCVETIISGPALERYYHAQSGNALRLPEIVQLADSNADPIALETINRLTEFFGKSLSVVVNILDPECIVLGGGVSNVQALYDEGVRHLERFTFNTRLDTKVVQHALGDSAGVFGAALLSK